MRAKALGLRVVAIDGDPAAPGLALADVGEAINITDPHAVTDCARRHGVRGVWAGAEAGVLAASAAATELDLPGVPPAVARCMRDKAAMRAALDQAGVPNVAYREAADLASAEQAAAELGLPVIVKPADGNASKGVRAVDHPADIALAFASAAKRAASGRVLIEEFVEGPEFNVDGLVHQGRFILGGITGKVVSPLPHRFDTGIYMPTGLGEAAESEIAAAVAQALEAVGYTTGAAHVEIILSPKGPRIVEMAARPGGGRIPSDLIPLTYGVDYVADSLRIALGEAPVESRRYTKGAALYWTPTHSGVVTAVEGVEAARATPGVCDVVVHAKPGDVMTHTVDCATRDKVGYVLAAGETLGEAVAACTEARDRIRIVTKPTLG